MGIGGRPCYHRATVVGGGVKTGQPGPSGRRPQAERSEMPRSASTACTRFFSGVARRTRLARWRSSARISLVAWGAIQASGSRSTRSSWARVAASTLSFFSLAEAIACSGWDGPGAVPAPVPPATRPASPSRRRPRTPPGCPAATRQGSAPAWPDRWRCCGCAGGRRCRRPRRPGSACGARPCRRTHLSRASFPELELVPKPRLSG
jgi:hypothetical protein